MKVDQMAGKMVGMKVVTTVESMVELRAVWSVFLWAGMMVDM